MATYNSNLKEVLELFDKNIYNAMGECGKFGVKEIKERTPVLSGDLKKGNRYRRRKRNSVTFQNRVNYSAYVNQGTYKMNAQPFFTSGILENLTGFMEIIVRNMKI